MIYFYLVFFFFLFSIGIVYYIFSIATDFKKQTKPLSEKVETLSTGHSVNLHSIRGGKVSVVSNRSGTIIRLSGKGSKFSGTINGKRINLEVPASQDWEEFTIDP